MVFATLRFPGVKLPRISLSCPASRIARCLTCSLRQGTSAVPLIHSRPLTARRSPNSPSFHMLLLPSPVPSEYRTFAICSKRAGSNARSAACPSSLLQSAPWASARELSGAAGFWPGSFVVPPVVIRPRAPHDRRSGAGHHNTRATGCRASFIHPGRNNSASPMCCGRILNELPQRCYGQGDVVPQLFHHRMFSGGF